MPTESLFWIYVSCGIQLFSLGQTGVAISFPYDLNWFYLFNVQWLLLLYSSCILHYGFIPWVIVAPLAVLNSNNFQPNSAAEFILEECHSVLSNGVWTQRCLLAWRQHMANENPFLNMTWQSNLCPSLGTPAQLIVASLVSSSSRRIIIYY